MPLPGEGANITSLSQKYEDLLFALFSKVLPPGILGRGSHFLHLLIKCPKQEPERRRNFQLLDEVRTSMHPALLLEEEPFVLFAQVIQVSQNTSLLHLI